MFRPLILAALVALTLPVAPAAAQPLPFVEVICSQSLNATGRGAAVRRNAEQSAIDAWDAEARRVHGATTPFNYVDGMSQRSRLTLSCASRLGIDTCQVRGRACVWVPTRTPNARVASACQPHFTRLDPSGMAMADCGPNHVGHQRPRSGPFGVFVPNAPRAPICPPGYRLDAADPFTCLRA